MIPFRTSRGAIFRCDADFSTRAVFNLNFYDSTHAAIPFHLSLRRDENLIVVNRRHAAGWHREIRLPMTFERRSVAVEIRFTQNHATVIIDGQKTGRFDAFPRLDRGGRFYLRRGFPGLREIAFVGLEGPLVDDSLEIECPAIILARPGVPVLNDALELVLQGVPPDFIPKGGKATLRVDGFEGEIPGVLRPLTYLLPRDPKKRRAHELAVIVPGRVWDSGADPLVMTLRDGAGRDLAPVTISRADLAARVGELAQSGGLATDDRAALQALEHTRHAGLLPHLTGDQKQALLSAAKRFRLVPYVLDAARDSSALPRPAPLAVVLPKSPDDHPWHVQDVLRARFTQTMRNAPQTDAIALLRTILATESLPPDTIEALLISLTEWFCLHGGMGDLAQVWRDQGLPTLQAELPHEDAWKTSALLPLFYTQGRFDAVAWALTQLANTTSGWVLTANIGWVLAQTAQNAADWDGKLASNRQRDEIVGSAIAWLDARGRVYWDRAPCLRVIDGMVALLSRLETLSRPRAVALEWTILSVYGLTPSFWDAVEQSLATKRWVLPFEMRHAQDAFADLRACLTMAPPTGADRRRQIAKTLQRFQNWGVIGRQQFRRELLGPAGDSHAPASLPDLEASHNAGMDPSEAALRYLAHPSTERPTEPLSAEIITEASKGLAAAHHVVPHSAYSDAQIALLKHATALLERPDPADFQDLIAAMDTTSNAEARYLGMGIGVSLANAMLSQGREDEAEALVQRIVDLVACLPEAWLRTELVWAPAPSLAMIAMTRAHPDHPVTLAAQQALGVSKRAGLVERAAKPPEPGVNPLLNTVVCLYSCRPNLDTRVAAIRTGWMRLLADIGVPCLVFVGDGQGQRDGDVVFLDAPDDYEGLPQKSLAMVRWVLENTQFAYLIKVDDDCFLDPQAYFRDLAHMKRNYCGRPLHRVRGQMDRAWHMAKSSHARGRLELDKSPEPSTYADGGSGYSLSRHAMITLCDAAQTPKGQELINLSFMEDKLVGDLLALGGVHVSGDDHRISVLRRTKPGGPLVPAWQNGFLPFAGSGVKLAHLDGHEKQAEVLAGSQSPWPQSLKIWPSYQPVKLGWNSNALDLISSREKLAEVNRAPVAVVACLRNEMFMLPRFLEHYRGLGVQGFLIADNGSDDGSFEYLEAQPDVALFAVDTEYRVSHFGVAWQQALISNFRVGRWSLAADADELLVWKADRSGSLPDLVETLEAEGADAVRIFMLDMYPQGSLAEADFRTEDPFEQAPFVDRDPFLTTSGARGPYSNSDVWTSALRHRLLPGSRAELFVAQKYALLKYQPWMRLSAGLHFVADIKPSQRELFFAHFKYNAAFRAKAETEVARQQHFNDAEEYRKYLALVSEGRDVVFDPALSVRWSDSPFVRDRLGR